MALTKKDILSTAREVEESKPIEALGGKTVKIRRLRDAEFNEIQRETLKGINLQGNKLSTADIAKMKNLTSKEEEQKYLDKMGIDLDIEELTKREKNANYLACAYGLSCDGEEWKVEEIGELPKGAPKEIADEVFRITNIDLLDSEEIENFREE